MTTRTLIVAGCAGLAFSLGSAAFAQNDTESKPKSTPPAAAEGGLSSNGVPLGDMSAYTVETVAEKLVVPWGFCWTGKDRMIFTERTGRVRVIEAGKLLDKPLHTLSDFKSRGENGLMGICVHPDYAKNKFVYLAYGEPKKDVRVVRFVDSGAELTEPKTIIEGIPAGANHAGCRPRFGPDGKLYITCGEAGNRVQAPDMNSLGGKTLRLNDDGSIPNDNPFYGKDGVRQEIYTLGHRNPQGMDWQPGSGLMFQSEHGPTGDGAPQGYDEVNIVEKGHNMGWPEIWGDKAKEGLDSPLLFWKKPVAPASAAFYNADLMPNLKGCLLVGCLGGLRSDAEPGIYVIKLDGRKVVSQERLATTYGRIREVEVGPDGAIYFSTSNKDGRGRPADTDDRIMRLVPKK